MAKLGVNIDHAATLRQVRYRGMEACGEPDVLQIALLCEEAGADGITAHLREDRRHIVDSDIRTLRDNIRTRLNLEMANTDEMVGIASKTRPAYVCLVPEKREELTTEGGLNVLADIDGVRRTCEKLQDSLNIHVSCFINADIDQVKAVAKAGARVIEIHTGPYAEHFDDLSRRQSEIDRIREAADLAASLGIVVNAGHGLNYVNTRPLVEAWPAFYELNIGHSILSRALFTGISEAVSAMKKLVE